MKHTVLVTVLLLTAVATVSAQVSWQHRLTQLLLNTPLFSNHQMMLKAKHPGTGGVMTDPTTQAYWKVEMPHHDDPYQWSGHSIDEDRYNKGAFCMDLDHELNNKDQTGTWINFVDVDDLINDLQTIGIDEPNFNEATCNLKDSATRTSIMDQSVATMDDGNGNTIADIETQFTSTSSWCDVRRIVKYRGALLWLMNNRMNLQNSLPTSGNIDQCTQKLTYSHVQAAIWAFIENKRTGAGLQSNTSPQCVNYVAREAMIHNDFMPVCNPDKTIQVVTPIVFKPNECNNNLTDVCRQYLIVDYRYNLTCPPSDDGLNYANISGYVYVDQNCNGQMEDNDVGYPGVTVKACTCPVQGQVQVCYFKQTDSTGKYEFINLPLGCYDIIEEDAPPHTTRGELTTGTGCNGYPGENDPNSFEQLFPSAPNGLVCPNYNFAHCPNPCAAQTCTESTSCNSVHNFEAEATSTGQTVKLCWSGDTCHA